MGLGCWVFLLGLFFQLVAIMALTNPQNAVALSSLTDPWQNKPSNWKGADPCGDGWVGITCNNSLVVSIMLSSLGLRGSLSGDIQSLSELQILDLSSNKGLTGSLPSSIGSLSKLVILILTGCNFFGTIPPEIGSLQRLVKLSLNSNSFSGSIPATIGTLRNLYWLDLADNKLTGKIPISSGTTPGLDMLTHTKHFHFGMNQLFGRIPRQLFSSDMNLIHLLLDNNNLSGRIPATLGLAKTLEVVRFDRNSLTGRVPSNLNSLTRIAELRLSNNLLSGPLPNLTGMSALSYVDLSNNSFDASEVPPWFSTLPSLTNLFLEYLRIEGQVPTSLFSFSPLQTVRLRNNSFTGTLDIGTDFSSKLEVVDLQNNKIGQVTVGGGYKNELINQSLKPPANLGPYYFIALVYDAFRVSGQGSKSSNLPVIVGASVGGLALVLLIVGVAAFAIKRRTVTNTVLEQSQPFESWGPSESSGSAPQLKGARRFSFEELKKSTNNFSESYEIGSGSYGKVYKGTLSSGLMVAVKRAQQGSMQGGVEFKNEIELLSRVHHKNLVSLIGFCFDHGEQMLIYEYFPNGSLRECLLGKSGIHIDWNSRLRVALGTARGLSYLHDHANPPIVHRDIKSSNVLLDDRLNAKVSDFGLSKLLGDEKSHVSTQVKGTIGYLDPEYYMTQQLTEKSDVYSFGVVVLELMTARQPIEHGRYIVREVRIKMDREKDLYGLHELLDPSLGLRTTIGGLEKFVDLAMVCVEDSGADRPTMSAVVKEIERIMLLAGVKENADSSSTSLRSKDRSKGHSDHPYSNEGNFDYSGLQGR